MGYPLKHDFKQGDPTALISADFLNTLARFFNDSEIQPSEDGTFSVERQQDGKAIFRVPSAAFVGTPAIFKTLIVREYDADGNLVAIGSETGGADRTLLLTYDVPRLP